MVNPYQRKRKRATDPMHGVMSDISDITKYKQEELAENDILNIDEYLNNKIIKSAELTNSIKSTLDRLGKHHSIKSTKNIIISESKRNTSGEN